MSQFQKIMNTVSDVIQSEEFEQFRANTQDFISARERGESAGTQITQMTASLDDVAEVINRSFPKQDSSGQHINVISPVVVPKGGRSVRWVFFTVFGIIIGLIGVGTSFLPIVGGLGAMIFGIHYWVLLVMYVLYSAWRNSFVMVPDGCHALIMKYGKLEEIVPAGKAGLGLHPFKQVAYIVNTTKEYPYNAPIREAPTSSRVNASVDLFLQFRVENPAEFIFTIGGAQGFTEKLQNAVSEVTRALIYEQNAENIYDLVGESTQGLLDTLNKQFLPAVRFVNANITHAEPSSQQYRMDLAAPEMVRVAKEAYTYQYQLKLRKEQDEGDLNKELAGLQESLSSIRAEIASFQAQMDTAREKEFNRASALAGQRLVEVESEARANAALLEAQSLDIRAINSARYPEILEYRFQQETLDRIEAVADHLPQMVHIGADGSANIDFMQVARHLMGLHGESLYSDEDLLMIRQRVNEISARIKERAQRISQIVPEEDEQHGVAVADEVAAPAADELVSIKEGNGGSHED
jgi:hypothetical protein